MKFDKFAHEIWYRDSCVFVEAHTAQEDLWDYLYYNIFDELWDFQWQIHHKVVDQRHSNYKKERQSI